MKIHFLIFLSVLSFSSYCQEPKKLKIEANNDLVLPLKDFLKWKINDKVEISDIVNITDDFIAEEYLGNDYIYHWSSTLAPLGVPSTIEFRQSIAPSDTAAMMQDVTYYYHGLKLMYGDHYVKQGYWKGLTNFYMQYQNSLTNTGFVSIAIGRNVTDVFNGVFDRNQPITIHLGEYNSGMYFRIEHENGVIQKMSLRYLVL